MIDSINKAGPAQSPLEAKGPSASIFPGMDVAVAQGLDWLGRDMEIDVEIFPAAIFSCCQQKQN